MNTIIQLLQEGDYACVIKNGEKIRTCTKRGVADLFTIYNNEPGFLEGAWVADKIVGKAAAAIMIAAGVKKLYTHTISTSALKLLRDQGNIELTYDKEVPFIINRDKTGWCPLEKLCFSEKSVDSILVYIKEFYEKISATSLVFIGLFLSLVSNGQAPPDTIYQAIDEIVVTGARYETDIRHLPMTISVVNRKIIEGNYENSLLPTLTEQISGLFTTSRGVMGYGVAAGAAGGMSLRGIGGSPTTGLLVLIDGHPQYMGLMGHPIADAYQSMLAEKVEVIRGPASVLYGSNAMGGVINIVTRKQKEDGVKTNVKIGAGSFNTFTSELSNQIKFKKFSSTISGSYNYSDGHRSNMDFEQYGGFAKLRYEINNNWAITGDVNITHFNAANPGTVASPIIDNDSKITRGMTSYSLENKSSKTSGALMFFYNWGHHNINDGYSEGQQAKDYRFDSHDQMFGISWFQSATLFEGNRVTAGFDYMEFGGKADRKFVSDNRTINLSEKTENEIAGYLDFRQQIGENLTFDAGIRIDNHSVTGTEWIPQFGLSGNLFRNSSVKAMVGKGFRNPTIRELYMFPPQNPDLKPERLWNYELSYSNQTMDNSLHYGINLFYINGENIIQTVPVDGRPLNVNTGEIENWGCEFSSSYNINQVWSVQANYSWLNMVNPVLAAPEHKLYASVSYTKKRWDFSTGVQYVAGLYTSLNTNTTENFILWNIRGKFQFNKHIDLFVRGENLLSQKYEINQGYPMPGVSFMTGFNLNF